MAPGLRSGRRLECRSGNNRLSAGEHRQERGQATWRHRVVLQKKQHKTARGLAHWRIV